MTTRKHNDNDDNNNARPNKHRKEEEELHCLTDDDDDDNHFTYRFHECDNCIAKIPESGWEWNTGRLQKVQENASSWDIFNSSTLIDIGKEFRRTGHMLNTNLFLCACKYPLSEIPRTKNDGFFHCKKCNNLYNIKRNL